MAWTTFKSWEAVGAWYQGLESDRIVQDAAIKAKVAELTAGKTTEEDKVKALYEYVATKIRCIGVAFGIGRYQPHHAGEVLENQYGDCKDKHTLLASMLTAAGLHPQAVLIGAGVRFNEAVPSPASFNHLITTVAVDGKQVWLDSTAEVAPYGALNYVIRDRKALVVPDSGVARIETTPPNLPFASSQKLTSVGTLEKERVSHSRLTWTFRGDEELIVRAAFRQASPGQYSDMVQEISKSIGYQGTTSNAEVSKLEDTSQPLTLSYDYKREKPGDWANLKILPQFAPAELPTVDEKDPPVQAIQLGVPRVMTSSSEMKLPEGWSAVLPDAIHAKSAYATFDETYRFEKGTLYADRRVEILKDVPVADWKTYKDWIDKWDLTSERFVQLVTSGNKAASATGVSRKPSNPEAAKLIESAYTEIESHDIEKAKTDLDQAKQLNPDEPYLWSTYGYYFFQLGGMNSAMEDYKKELAMYPERVDVYPSLVSAEASLRMNKEIKETLAEWISADSRNPEPAAKLGIIQLQEGDNSGAMNSMETALARIPEDQKKKNEVLLLELGEAQMRSGKKEKAHDTLLALMKDSGNPVILNDSAYELGDAGQELTDDESAARKALEIETTASKNWTLEDASRANAAKSRSLIAVWDTLGWILYKEGKPDEAEGYLRAAWINAQGGEIAEHIARVEEAKGHKNEALSMYRLGIAASQPGPEQKKLQAKADELEKAGVKSPVKDAHAKLQENRKLSLGPAKGMDGVAEYTLLMSDGKIIGAKKTGDKNISGAEERLKEVSLAGYWPAGSDAKLVRLAMLNCHSGNCELVFLP